MATIKQPRKQNREAPVYLKGENILTSAAGGHQPLPYIDTSHRICHKFDIITHSLLGMFACQSGSWWDSAFSVKHLQANLSCYRKGSMRESQSSARKSASSTNTTFQPSGSVVAKIFVLSPAERSPLLQTSNEPAPWQLADTFSDQECQSYRLDSWNLSHSHHSSRHWAMQGVTALNSNSRWQSMHALK